MLKVWPPLPIVVQADNSKMGSVVDDVVAALEHSDRIWHLAIATSRYCIQRAEDGSGSGHAARSNPMCATVLRYTYLVHQTSVGEKIDTKMKRHGGTVLPDTQLER